MKKLESTVFVFHQPLNINHLLRIGRSRKKDALCDLNSVKLARLMYLHLPARMLSPDPTPVLNPDEGSPRVRLPIR